jgi:predicted nuclease of predicted toxin-antitoxin system
MPRTLRFHLDEVCDPRIAAGLRLRGVDVSTAADTALRGKPDESHLAYCRAQARVIVTHDTDFLRLHATGASHPGIVFCPQQARPLGELIRLLALIWEVLEPGEMQNHVEYL